jgi:hypothetical protein
MEIIINGLEYKLKYDINSISDLEDKIDKSINDLIQNIGISACRSLLWAGIKHSNKYLTLKDVGAMMNNHLKNGGDFKDLIPNIVVALKESGILGKEEENQAEDKKEISSDEKKEDLKKDI